MKTINLTISELTDDNIYHLENFLRDHYAVKDFKILPDTKELYDTDPYFQKMTKKLRADRLAIDRYINDKKEC